MLTREPFRKDAQIKPADTWGKDLTVALKAPCGKPLEILIDMIDKNAKMPGLGVNDKWDESIKVARRVKVSILSVVEGIVQWKTS